MSSPIADRIAKDLGFSRDRVQKTLALFDEGATIPFITRYRKEVTGGMNEDDLRRLSERAEIEKKIDERRDDVKRLLAEVGHTEPALIGALDAATTLQEIEDLYLPFRPKRKTRAQAAREAGLGELAEILLAQKAVRGDRAAVARPFVSPEKGIDDAEAAWAGARDIAAESLAESPAARARTREILAQWGRITSKKKKDADPEEKYAVYHDYSAAVSQVAPHAVLALNRGESESVLSVGIEIDLERLAEDLAEGRIKASGWLGDELMTAIKDGTKRLLFPAIEREIRNDLTERAENRACDVFAANLRSLLLIAPLAKKTVLGIDPGFRTGSKLAAIDPLGRVLSTGVVSIFDQASAKKTIVEWIKKWKIDVVAIGNGTASRETEAVVASAIRALSEGPEKRDVAYTMVNEAGASVYSASEEGRDEFPDFDATERGTISIARRLQDPLAELVKIPPESLGIGLYQHDIEKKRLAERLEGVVVSCVNHVGVDLNTASTALLTYVAGLQKKTAKAIVGYREKAGAFRSRREVNEVKGVGAKAFEQAAGFLRIADGDEPLDATAIHPESYDAARKLLLRYGARDLRALTRADFPTFAARIRADLEAKKATIESLAAECGVGVPTLSDIVDSLARPGRDPRDESPRPILRSDILKIEDLAPGMQLKGTVRNVVDFGAFVDLGVKIDGLIHISAMGTPRPKHPIDILSAGDVVDVEIISIDTARGRIALAWKKS